MKKKKPVKKRRQKFSPLLKSYLPVLVYGLVVVGTANWSALGQIGSSFGSRVLTYDFAVNKVLHDNPYLTEEMRNVPMMVVEAEQLFAMSTGLPTPRIVVSSDMVLFFSKPELSAVLLHELGHFFLNHYYYELFLHVVIIAAGWFVIKRYSLKLYVIVIGGLLGGLMIIQIAQELERAADRFAYRFGADPVAVIGVTKKFAEKSYQPATFLQKLFYRSVPFEERVEEARLRI